MTSSSESFIILQCSHRGGGGGRRRLEFICGLFNVVVGEYLSQMLGWSMKNKISRNVDESGHGETLGVFPSHS
jgi:hypothetical protein